MLLCVVLAACGGGDGVDPDAGSGADGGGGVDATEGCVREPAAANRARKVVVSHPYDEDSNQAPTWEVVSLGTDGSLTRGATFEMGRATDGRVAFTPDGEIGMVAQEDGTLGVFRITDADTPEVLHAAYDAGGADGFYATGVVMAADGSHAWVLNGQWRDNGGGIYRITIGCDGELTYDGLVAAAKLPYAMVMLPGGRALVAADDVLDSGEGGSAHLVDLGEPAAVAAADAFGDDESIVSDAALTADGEYLLLGDNNQFYDTPGLMNRVAVVGVNSDDTLDPIQVMTPIEDPYSIVASPHGDGALLVSGFGDAIFEVDFDSGLESPFSVAGELSYTGGGPQLPGDAVMIDRGDLTGLVLISENQGIRSVRFTGGGAIVDDGLTALGSGLTAIVGAIGVQP